jgi:hypothetical protein
MAEEKNTSKGVQGSEGTTAPASEPKIDKVKLKKKNGKENDGREFPIAQANTLLKLPNSQWEIGDNKYQWNGTEIAKK